MSESEPSRSCRPGPASTSTEDLTNCYRLILGREPESAAVVEPRPDTPAAEAAIAFLLSAEFRHQVLEPALDERLVLRSSPDAALRLWVQRTFDTVPPADVNAYGLLAFILQKRWIVAQIDILSPSWPCEPLAARLMRAGRGSAVAFASLISSGAKVLEVHGVQDHGNGDRVTCAADASVIFAVDGDAAQGDLVLLELIAPMDDRCAVGRLQLDYGGGFRGDYQLRLRARSDDVTEAVLAAAGRLRRVRWVLTDRRSTGRLTRLSARPMALKDALSRAQDWRGSAAALFGDTLRSAVTEPEAGLACALSRALSPPPLNEYEIWLQTNEPVGADALKLWRAQLAGLEKQPLISIVTPVYNTPARFLLEMFESVCSQVYPNWELCIADDASTEAHVRPILEAFGRQDERVRLVFRKANGHISRASNSALELATGDWTVLLDHDDLLRPNALLALALEVERSPHVQIVYSDEDKLDGLARKTPYFKPDYSPELFLAQNYFNHLTAHRTGNIRAVGGWRPGFEGSQDYDLSLRILERIKASQVRHIPEVLYHWRAVEGSTASGVEEKGYAVDAGRRALQEHLDRTRPGATAQVLDSVPHYRVRNRPPAPTPMVSLIMPTRDQADVLRLAVQSILTRSTYSAYEIIIVDNDSVDRAALELLADQPRVRVVAQPSGLTSSALINHAARSAYGDVIALVSDHIEVITPDWLEEMVSWSLQDGVGCVGAKLLYPDMTVQHAGMIVGLGRVAGHSQQNLSRSSPGYFGRLAVHHNVSAVSSACLLIRREIFQAVAGLDEHLISAFYDVDLCLRVREAGYRNLVTPYAELINHKQNSCDDADLAGEDASFNKDVEFMVERWKALLRVDPYYSPNLTHTAHDFSLGETAHVRARLSEEAWI